jgi:hypothetical protein
MVSSMSPSLEPSAKTVRAALRDPAFAGLTSLSWMMLVASRGVVQAVPLRRITSYLGQPGVETPLDDVPRHRYRRVRRIRSAIVLAASLTPTTSNCYPQALTAHTLLRMSRLACTVYYGARFDEAGYALDTHVWVRCGPFFVTGGPGHRQYAALGTYAHLPRGSAAASSHARREAAAPTST